MSHYKFFISPFENLAYYRNMSIWLNENCTPGWRWCYGVIYFWDEQDALAFKLKYDECDKI